MKLKDFLSNSETTKLEKEHLCSLRLSYNNFDEKVPNNAQDYYSECLK
jgi:hypothetical protein